MDDQVYDLRLRIKEFIAKDAEFRNPNFDPAPFLIQILKEKSADHQAMIERQNQLIQLQNEAREIIDEVCSEYNEEFIKFLNVPQFYAGNLEKLKSNVSVVKKKVKETKALLLNTQKDIQQIHFNCMLNKTVYRKLKQIELRLAQYETAFLALKNNQFMNCSMNLPHIEGHSILESTLSSRAETLRLRMLSKAIHLINLFLFFSPKIVLPSSNVLLDMLEHPNPDETIISNWSEHESFFKRYKLFKKADCENYLSKIWNLSDLERKEGKLGLMYDIIKGVMNLGRMNQVSSSIQINGPKQISNIFLLLKCFRIKEGALQKVSKKWFVDRSPNDSEDRLFISAILCIVGVILRKSIIIHKIYNDFAIEEYNFSSTLIYQCILEELVKLIKILYFPHLKDTSSAIEETNEEQLNSQFSLRLSSAENYINYGHTKYLFRVCLKIIEKNVSEIEATEFKSEAAKKEIVNKGEDVFYPYSDVFYELFHKDFCLTIEQIFNKEGRSFLSQAFHTVAAEKNFNENEIKFMKGYSSDDKKCIKQYVNTLSFLKTLQEYFEANHLQKDKLYKYTAFIMEFFYLKLNYHVQSSLIPVSELMIIQEQRKTDKKLKKKEEEVKRVFYKILPDKPLPERVLEPETVHKFEGAYLKEANYSFHIIDKLKIFSKQNKMLLTFSVHFFEYIEEWKNSPSVVDYYNMISRLEPANYEDNFYSRLLRIWDSLPSNEDSLKECLTAILYKIMELNCVICTKLYRQTSAY